MTGRTHWDTIRKKRFTEQQIREQDVRIQEEVKRMQHNVKVTLTLRISDTSANGRQVREETYTRVIELPFQPMPGLTYRINGVAKTYDYTFVNLIYDPIEGWSSTTSATAFTPEDLTELHTTLADAGFVQVDT